MQPFGMTVGRCSVCAQGWLIEECTSSTEWKATGIERHCTHCPFGTDREMRRTNVYEINCTVCSYGYDRTAEQYMWECHGYY